MFRLHVLQNQVIPLVACTLSGWRKKKNRFVSFGLCMRYKKKRLPHYFRSESNRNRISGKNLFCFFFKCRCRHHAFLAVFGFNVKVLIIQWMHFIGHEYTIFPFFHSSSIFLHTRTHRCASFMWNEKDSHFKLTTHSSFTDDIWIYIAGDVDKL